MKLKGNTLKIAKGNTSCTLYYQEGGEIVESLQEDISTILG